MIIFWSLRREHNWVRDPGSKISRLYWKSCYFEFYWGKRIFLSLVGESGCMSTGCMKSCIFARSLSWVVLVAVVHPLSNQTRRSLAQWNFLPWIHCKAARYYRVYFRSFLHVLLRRFSYDLLTDSDNGFFNFRATNWVSETRKSAKTVSILSSKLLQYVVSQKKKTPTQTLCSVQFCSVQKKKLEKSSDPEKGLKKKLRSWWDREAEMLAGDRDEEHEDLIYTALNAIKAEKVVSSSKSNVLSHSRPQYRANHIFKWKTWPLNY